jgi:polysaccharide export outer membrane protein
MKKALSLLALLMLLAVPAIPAFAEEEEFTIAAGDVLQVTVWKEDGMDREIVVLPDGSITFPLVGSLNIKDKTPQEVQDLIKEKLKKFIPDASVVVVVKAALGHSVSVIGQVQKPGEFIMGHHFTVMQALSQAGGLTPFANENGIIILRHNEGKEISIPFPYKDIIDGDKLDKNITLKPGDVIVVPTGGIF